MAAKPIGPLEVLMTPKIRAALVCKTCCMARFGPLKTISLLLTSNMWRVLGLIDTHLSTHLSAHPFKQPQHLQAPNNICLHVTLFVVTQRHTTALNRQGLHSGFKLACFEILMWLEDFNAGFFYQSMAMNTRSGAVCDQLPKGSSGIEM